MVKNKKKIVDKQEEWARVAAELEDENIKLQSYDYTLIPWLGELRGKKVLDYGAGPGILATVIARQGADVKVYDISKEMRELASGKIGKDNVYEIVENIPEGQFDFVVCNLVLCIVEEKEVANIAKNIKGALNENGCAYVGFCNPKIHNIAESQLDFRPHTGKNYEEKHVYMKTKKEGNYEIVENHRPVEWYVDQYEKAGLVGEDILFTPEYELKGNRIQDFIIFKLKKGEKQ